MPSIDQPIPELILLHLRIAKLELEKAELSYHLQVQRLLQEAGVELPAGVSTYTLDIALGCLRYDVPDTFCAPPAFALPGE